MCISVAGFGVGALQGPLYSVYTRSSTGLYQIQVVRESCGDGVGSAPKAMLSRLVTALLVLHALENGCIAPTEAVVTYTISGFELSPQNEFAVAGNVVSALKDKTICLNETRGPKSYE